MRSILTSLTSTSYPPPPPFGLSFLFAQLKSPLCSIHSLRSPVCGSWFLLEIAVQLVHDSAKKTRTRKAQQAPFFSDF